MRKQICSKAGVDSNIISMDTLLSYIIDKALYMAGIFITVACLHTQLFCI